MSLIVKSLIKKYGPLYAVKGVSFEVGEGETLVLLGPSGCGKTTTLRMIAGLEVVDRGEITIGQTNISNLSASKRDVAFMFQRPVFFPNRTVIENISYPLLCRERNWKYLLKKGIPIQYREKVEELGRRLSLSSLLDRYPDTLSGGELQRASLARAMLKEASVLLLDEPLANVDAQLRDSLRRELLKLKQFNNEKIHGSIVYVTHDQEDAMLLGDKVAVMNKGELLQIDSPISIYNNPVNLFIAQFVGRPQINILPAKIASVTETSVQILLFEKVFTAEKFDNEPKLSIMPGMEILIGLRPHALHLTNVGQLKGMLTGIIELGGFQQISISIHGQKIQVITQDKIAKKVGEEIALSINSDSILMFDIQSGIRL